MFVTFLLSCVSLECGEGTEEVDGECVLEEGDIPECPWDIESFCLYEFGSECPNFAQASAMTCDGYHFDPSGSTGEPPFTSDGGGACSDLTVSCGDDTDPNIRTRIYFEPNGTFRVVDMIWPDGDPCSRNGYYGDAVC